MSLSSPSIVLGTEDNNVLLEAQALIRSGLSESEGVALRVAGSRILKVQTDLSNLKGMLLYSVSLKKNDLAKEWYGITDTYADEKLPYHRLETYANVDPKYSAIKSEISAYEALLSVIEDNLWALRSIVRFYQP